MPETSIHHMLDIFLKSGFFDILFLQQTPIRPSQKGMAGFCKPAIRTKLLYKNYLIAALHWRKAAGGAAHFKNSGGANRC
jgi:hypothetical protein